MLLGKRVDTTAVNGGGEHAVAVAEPTAAADMQVAIEHENSPTPPLPETDGNEPKEVGLEEDKLDLHGHGIHLDGHYERSAWQLTGPSILVTVRNGKAMKS